MAPPNWNQHFAKVGAEAGDSSRKGDVAMAKLMQAEAAERQRRRRRFASLVGLVVLVVIGVAGWLCWPLVSEWLNQRELEQAAAERPPVATPAARSTQDSMPPATAIAPPAPIEGIARESGSQDDGRITVAPDAPPPDAVPTSPVTGSPPAEADAGSERERARAALALPRLREGVRVLTKDQLAKVTAIDAADQRLHGTWIDQQRKHRRDDGLIEARDELVRRLEAVPAAKRVGADWDRQRTIAYNASIEIERLQKQIAFDAEILTSVTERLTKAQAELAAAEAVAQ